MKQSSSIFLPGLAAGILCLFIVVHQPAIAQDLRIQGTNPTLTITAGNPGGALIPVVNSSSTLRYKQAGVPTKITVQTVCPGQRFYLSVEAIAVGDGTPAPVVTLSNGMLPTDFITNIGAGSKKNFQSDLQYTASASFSQGNSTELGDDIHTVTYTLVAQ